MTPVQRQSAAALTAHCVDSAVIALSLWLAYALRGLHDPDPYVLAGVVAVLLYLIAGGGAATRRDAPTSTPVQDIATALGAWILTLAGLLVVAWMTKATADYSRIAIGLWAVTGALGLLAWRVVRHVTLRSSAGKTRAVIAGSGPPADRCAQFLAATPAFHATVGGYFDEPNPPNPAPTDTMSVPLLGDFDALLQGAEQREFSTVFVALPANSEQTAHRLVAALSDTPATVYVVPSPFAEELAHARWVSLGGLPLVSVLEPPFAGYRGWVKRLEDLFVSLAILAVAAVPMACIAAAVKLTSPGPVLFRQRRHGIDGREIRVVKFRTMTVQEDGDAVRLAVRSDSRLTPIGGFLRRTSLDELPQFFNVVRGEMSVVGPRPHATAVNEHYRRLIPGYMLRHRVKPGVTGWAQIHGLRGGDTVEHMTERVRYDLWYVGRWSIWLDLWIVVRTVALLAGDRNAV